MRGIYWLASYPRSGNTWTRLLLDSYVRGGAGVDINNIGVVRHTLYSTTVFDGLMGVSSVDLDPAQILAWRPAVLRKWLEQNDQTTLVKCHDMRRRQPDGDWLIPADVSLGGTCLVRDPRDVALSLAEHIDRTIDETITRMETPDLVMGKSIIRQSERLPNLWGSWSQNVESWLAADPFPVHVVRYEDLRRDTAGVFAGMLNALGFVPDDGRIAAAVAATELASLRQQEDTRGFSERRSRHRFFGAGAVGGWRDRLSADQVARIEAAHGPAMRRLGYLD